MQIFATFFATVLLGLAMPELPPDTIATLQLVEGQAENLALQSEGVNMFEETTSSNSAQIGATLSLFAGLYRGLQAWNEWQGGDDYIINRQYVVQRTDLPEWLADYAGDVIFWELEYFGHTVEMLTDKDGQLLVNNEKGKALNVRMKDTMIQGAQKFKAENPGYKNISVLEYAPKGYPSTLDSVSDPYIQNGVLYLPVLVNGTEYTFTIPGTSGATIKDYYFWLRTFENSSQGFRLYIGNNDISAWPSYINVSNSGCTTSGDPYTYNYKNCTCINFSNGVNYTFKLPMQWQQSTGYAGQNRRSDCINYGNTVNCIGVYNSQPVLQSSAPLLYKTINAAYVTPLPSWGDDLIGQSISAQSLDEIQDSISVVQPQTDPETGIEIIEIPQEFPVPEDVPLEPESDPLPDDPIGPGIEDFPSSDPDQVPEYDPEIDPAIEATEDELPDSESAIPLQENLSIVTGLQNRFPFSIPWDIYNALSMLQAERETPHWEWLMQINLPGGETFEYNFVLDLGFMSNVAKLFRDLFLLSFILGLAVFSYNKFFGGGA